MATTFQGLTFEVYPVLTTAGALNTTDIVAGTTVIAGILDPMSTSRIFNPYAEGLAPATSDAVSKWLPTVATNGFTAAKVTDNYWSSVAAQVDGTATGVTDVGQITLALTPGSLNTVEASSVMTFKLSPQALVITCTTSTF